MTTQPPVGPLDSESVKLSPHDLEQIAHNLCSLHGFDPAFVVTQEAFARAVIREYVRLPQQAGEGAASEAGPAEREVGRAVYERIETLLKTDPRGAELDYLSHLAESVEEVGGYDGPLAPFAKTWTPPTDPRWDRAIEALEKAVWSLSSFGQLAADEEGGNTEGLDDEVIVRMTFPDPEFGGEKTLLGELFIRAFRKAKAATDECRQALASIRGEA